MDDRALYAVFLLAVVAACLMLALHIWRSGRTSAVAVTLGAVVVTGGTLMAIGNGMTRGFLAGFGWLVAGAALIAGPGLGLLPGLILGALIGPYPAAKS